MKLNNNKKEGRAKHLGLRQARAFRPFFFFLSEVVDDLSFTPYFFKNKKQIMCNILGTNPKFNHHYGS
jgi:hypothetical protein